MEIFMLRSMKWVMASLIFMSTVQCNMVHVKERGTAEPEKIKTKPEIFAARKGNELKKRIIVLPFLNATNYQTSVASDARDLFIKTLQKHDEVLLLDWKNAGVTQLDNFQDANGYKVSDISKRVRPSGVHALVVGTIKELRTGKSGDSVGVFRRVKAQVKAVVEIQVISVRSGKVMMTETREADTTETTTKVAQRAFGDSDLKDNPEAVRTVVEMAFEKTVPLVVDSLQRFAWEGRVALVKGEKVYLNAGRLSGLQIGDILSIMDGTEEIFDPETSQSLGSIKGRVKGTVEVLSYFGNDGAVTIIHSGSGFKENDLVEFY